MLKSKKIVMNSQVTCYASKKIGLYSKPTVIFRSDSNGEDLEGYAGAGLYDRFDSQILNFGQHFPNNNRIKSGS